MWGARFGVRFVPPPSGDGAGERAMVVDRLGRAVEVKNSNCDSRSGRGTFCCLPKRRYPKRRTSSMAQGGATPPGFEPAPGHRDRALCLRGRPSSPPVGLLPKPCDARPPRHRGPPTAAIATMLGFAALTPTYKLKILSQPTHADVQCRRKLDHAKQRNILLSTFDRADISAMQRNDIGKRLLRKPCAQAPLPDRLAKFFEQGSRTSIRSVIVTAVGMQIVLEVSACH